MDIKKKGDDDILDPDLMDAAMGDDTEAEEEEEETEGAEEEEETL